MSSAHETGTGTATDRATPGEPRATARPPDTAHRLDRIRWGAVWTGALTTLTTNVVLQLLFFTFGWLDLDGVGSTTATIVSAIAGLIAYLLGGVATGASALWDRPDDGLVNGVVTWALTTVLLMTLAIGGGGTLFGYAGTVFGGFGTIGAPEAAGLARDTAGWAVLALGVSALAAAAGGAAGSRIWPRRTARG